MQDTDWLSNLNIGDEVVVYHNHWTRGLSIGRVAKLTKTQIVVDANSARPYNIRFNNQTGREIGSGYNLAHLYAPTDELRASIHRTELLSKVTDRKASAWATLTTEELEQVVSILCNAKLKQKSNPHKA